MAFLRDSASTPVNTRLKELLQYDSGLTKCPAQNDTTYTLLLKRIGLLYYTQADYLKAIQYTRRSIGIIRTYTGKIPEKSKYLAGCYYNMQIYYDSLKQTLQKIEATDSCIANDIITDSTYYYTCLLLGEKVKYLFYKGDYTLCVNDATWGETLIRKYYHQPDSINRIFYFLTYQVDALHFLKNYQLAEKLLSNKINECEKAGNRTYLGIIYSLLGFVYIDKGAFLQSLGYFQKGYRQNLFIHYRKGCTESLYQAGLLYFEKFNKYDHALQYYYKALVYADAVDSFYILGSIANVYARKGQYDSSRILFQRAFDQIKPGINENQLLQDPQQLIGDNIAEFLTGVVLDKGDALFDQYKATKNAGALEEATRTYKTADQLLTKIKAEQTELKSKLYWRAHTRRLYEHSIEISYIRSNTADAFYFFEKSRAVLLNDEVNEQKWNSNDDILQLAQAKKKILELNRELTVTDTTSTRYTVVQRGLFDNRQELVRLEKSIREHNSLYYQSMLDTSFIGLPDIQKYLSKDNRALLELFTGDSAVYSLMVTPQHCYLSRINKKDFDTTVNLYISCIANPALLNSNFENYAHAAHHLYQLLFQNIPLPDGRIIISPDGRYFPFEALVTNDSFRRPAYFLDDHPTSYTYSARYLLNDFALDAASVSGSFMGMAPVQYASGFHLNALPGSDQSLALIGANFHQAINFIAARASKNNFLRNFTHCRIIQLYTHANYNSNNNEPVIYFADSALYLSDLIAENKPATALVVLSACETGNGELYQGEGVFSFSRGFAALGIPSSISNLWSVDDLSTYHLTELFYKYLSDGDPTDVALQKAKKEFLRHASKMQQLPYYWAAPILVGKTAVLLQRPSGNWKFLIPLLLAALIISFMTIRLWRISHPKRAA
jgi:CHAT domain-containing protein